MSQEPVLAATTLFIRRWGEMGATWGISRTMAEIHALLYLASDPLCTDDVMEQLSISRGSASMNLRALGNWGLVQRVHRRGDRKEYFEAEKDVWQMFETILRERRRREVLPIVETIERCLALLSDGKRNNDGTKVKDLNEQEKRFRDILEFCDILNTFTELMSKVSRDEAKPLAAALQELVG